MISAAQKLRTEIPTSRVLFLVLALLPNVGGVRTFVGLNVLEASFLAAHSVKLLAFGATVSCPLRHVVRLSQFKKTRIPHQPRGVPRGKRKPRGQPVLSNTPVRPRSSPHA